jgi:hypothetical protein
VGEENIAGGRYMRPQAVINVSKLHTLSKQRFRALLTEGSAQRLELLRSYSKATRAGCVVEVLDPDHPAVREALLRVLKTPGRTPSERYRALLGPVCCWLAAALARDKMLAGLSWISPMPQHNKAEVHNFVGSYLTYRDPDHGAFLRSAERELRLAINEDPSWYLPHDNLGDVLSYAGRQYDAIESYSKALDLLVGPLTQKRALRIRLARDMAKLLSGDPALRQEASDNVGTIENDIANDQDPDARFLYNLACWYAVLGSFAAEGWEDAANARVERARLLLTAAFTMDDSGEVRVWFEKDPDLAKVREGPARVEL